MIPTIQKSIGRLVVLFLFLDSFQCNAQSVAPKNSLSDYMRSDGKLWVVIAVITNIFIGLIYYIRQIARRVSKIKGRI